MIKLILPLLLLFSAVAGCDSLTEEDYVNRARAHLAEGRDNAAVVELKNALAMNPDNMLARWLLGEIHLDHGRFADAAKELAAARRLGVADDSTLPLMARAWLGEGDLANVKQLQTTGLSAKAKSQVLAAQAAAQMAEGELNAAERSVQEALASDPDSTEAKTEQARLVAATNDVERAIELLQTLGTEHSYVPAWALLGDLEKKQGKLEAAEAAYDKTIELRKANTMELLKRGLLRIQMAKYAEAQADIEQVKRRLPKHFEANYGLGVIHFLNERYGEALPLLEASVADNDNFMPAIFYLAATHLKLGNAAEAERLAARVVAQLPNAIAGRKLLAQIRFAEGNYTEVAELLKPVVSTTPDDAAAINMLAAAYLRQGKNEEAFYLYEKLVELEPESAQAYLRLGGVLLLQGDEQQGLAELAKALQLNPELVEVYQVQADHFMKHQAYEQALEAIAAYRDASPGTAGPLFLEGQVRLSQGKPELARQAFVEASKIAPDEVLPSHALAALDIQEGNYADARTLYMRVLQHHPEHLDTLMKLAVLEEMAGQQEQMVARLQQAITAHPGAAAPRVSLARHHLAEGRPDQVPVALGELIGKRQDAPGVIEVYGMAQLAQGDPENARLSFARLVDLQPRSAKAHYLLAQALSRLNDGAGLQRELERVLEIDPDHLAARIGLARVLLLRRDLTAAQQQLAVLEDMAPGNPDVIALRGALAQASGDTATASDAYSQLFQELSTSTTMLALARQKWEVGDQLAALALMEKWVAGHPDDAAALLALASANNKAGRHEQAVAQYQRALVRFGDNPTVLNNLAWLLKDDDPSMALEYAEKAAALAPDSPAVADTYAMALSRKGQHTKAQRVIERAVGLAPDTPVLRYHSALIDAAAGQTDRAVATLTALLSEHNDFPEREGSQQLLSRLRASGS